MKKKNWLEIASYFVLSLVLLCIVIPIALLVVSSFTDEQTLLLNGYSLFPQKWSLDAYFYIVQKANTVLSCYGNTFLYTALGTLIHLLLCSMYGYVLSYKQLPGRKFLSFVVFFTVLFNGGVVPSYLMWTGIFHIKNTFWAQLVPNLMMNAMSVLMMRTFFVTSIPSALYEAAAIDGAGHLRVYSTIVLPLGKPILATLGLFAGLAYWNDWINGLYYVTNIRYYNIQNYLYRLISDTQFLLSNSEGSGAAELLPSTSVKMAIACVAILPMMCLFPFLSKYFRKGLTVGAVKG